MSSLDESVEGATLSKPISAYDAINILIVILLIHQLINKL